MKHLLYLLTVLTLLCCASCNDDSPCEEIITEEPVEDVRITDVSGVTLNYTKDLEIGGKENEIIFEKWTDILLQPEGHKIVKTLNCCGLAAVALNGMEIDTTKSVERVTLINRETITVHTKDLVERYKDLIATPENPDRPYFYLRVLVMYAGNNCSVINKGVINVYFDHDPSNTSTIYTIALTAHDGSTIINEGEINFYGNGSENTRFRGVATEGNYLTAINKGVMTSNVEMVDDQRMITTGGKYNNIINDGIMKLYGPGEICGLSSGSNNVVNNNLIDITRVDISDKYVSVEEEPGVVCGIYYAPSDSPSPSVVNRGTINMRAITTSKTSPALTVNGINVNSGKGIEVSAINDGTITTAQTGPIKLRMAEAFFHSVNKPLNVKMSRWNTTLRDFTEQPLFRGENVIYNFTDGKLVLSEDTNYVEDTYYSVAPDCLLQGSKYSGYENMTIKSNDKNIILNWDKENQKASFSKKQ